MRPVRTRFRFGFTPYIVLNLAIYNNSLDRSTKSTTSHLNVLCLFVSIGFHVLFHSPPGVLFNFPSRYYTLSVTRSYLAFGDGPPIFTLDSTCPVLLWILARVVNHLTYGAITLFRLVFQKTSAMFDYSLCCKSEPQGYF